jgi:hypothetical protein
MPFRLTWEPRGVYRQYFGDVTIAERLESFEAICGHRRFDELRYTITDYLDVGRYEVTAEATEVIAALHIAPLRTNPRVLMAAVAVKPEVVMAIKDFIGLQYTERPYRVFPTLEAAREWLQSTAATTW